MQTVLSLSIYIRGQASDVHSVTRVWQCWQHSPEWVYHKRIENTSQSTCSVEIRRVIRSDFVAILRSVVPFVTVPSVTNSSWRSGQSHYNDVIMGSMTSRIASLTIVYSAVYSGGDQRKHQSSTSLVFVRGIHRGPVNFPHKWPVTRKMFPFDDVSWYVLLQLCPAILCIVKCRETHESK